MPYHIVRLRLDPSALAQLKAYQLLKQWHKAERYILSGVFDAIDFRKRRPYADSVDEQIFYFRLSQKYRAHGVFTPDNPHEFTVIHIDDHQ